MKRTKKAFSFTKNWLLSVKTPAVNEADMEAYKKA